MQDVYLGDGAIQKMVEGLEKNQLAFTHNGNTYLLFNQIEIEVGGEIITFKKDGESVGYIKTAKIEPGDTVYLYGVIGYLWFDLS